MFKGSKRETARFKMAVVMTPNLQDVIQLKNKLEESKISHTYQSFQNIYRHIESFDIFISIRNTSFNLSTWFKEYTYFKLTIL